jgi:hypothetical protein
MNINSLPLIYVPENKEEDQISMEFEWLDEDSNYTTRDQGDPEPLPDTFLDVGAVAGQCITISTQWSGGSNWVTIPDANEKIADKLDGVVNILRELQDRLLVVEEKDEDYFEGRAALKKAYDKFRMLEALYGKKKDE